MRSPSGRPSLLASVIYWTHHVSGPTMCRSSLRMQIGYTIVV